MSETNVLGVASSSLEIADLAAKVSVRLFALSRKVTDALKPVEALSKDIAQTGAILNQLGHQLKKDQDVRVGSTTLVTSVDDLVEECSHIFESIDKALDGDNSGSKAILGLQHYVHIASLQPQLAVLETSLERLKMPLALVLQVLIYAEQLKSQEDQMALKEQQELIRAYNEERKGHERRFHKLTAVTKATSESPDLFGRSNMKDLPPTPPPLDMEFKDDEARGRARMWVKDQQPPTTDNVPEAATSFLRDISPKTRLPGEQAHMQGPHRLRNLRVNDESSLLDMATFLRSDPHENEDSENKDSPKRRRKFRRPRYNKQQARDPVIKGSSSELINFFRDRSPTSTDQEPVRDARSPTPVLQQHVSNPAPPVVDTEPEKPVIPVNSEPARERKMSIAKPEIVKRLLHSRADPDRRPTSPPAVAPNRQFQVHVGPSDPPAPLASNPPTAGPPLVKIDISRPSKPSWPQPDVITWLDQNSFSQEWQATFRALNIHGTEFIALESGSSIRKMLTVIYPQLAKQCSESGKGWDQSRERAEGFRLRTLLREMPVGDKYAGGEDGGAAGDEKPKREHDMVRHTSPSSPTSPLSPTALARSYAVPRGRRPAIVPTSKTSTPIPEEQAFIGHDTHFRDVSPLREDDERRIAKAQKAHAEAQARSAAAARSGAKAALLMHGADASLKGPTHISDEWVRKWTVLSSAEIARGRSRELAPSLMV